MKIDSTALALLLILLSTGAVATSSARGVAAQTPAPPETFTARWEPASLPVFAGVEQANPWSHRTPGTPAPVWQLYEASPQDAPRLLYETPRSLGQPIWAADGRSMRMTAASNGESTTENREMHPVVAQIRLDPASGVTQETLFASAAPLMAPDGRSMAFQKGLDVFIRVPGMPDRTLVADHPYSVVIGWAPDSTALLVGQIGITWPHSAPQPVYLVPLVDGAADYVFTLKFLRPSWSHDGGRLAHVSEGDVFVYDRHSKRNKRLTVGGAAAGFTGNISWAADDSKLIVGTDLFDATTGARIVRLKQPGSTLTSSLTPDGRYFVATDYSVGYQPGGDLCQRPAVQNHTYVHDLVAGTTRTLRDCEGTFRRSSEGVLMASDGRHRAVMQWPSCWSGGTGCQGAAMMLEMLTLEDSTTVEMGTGTATVSPDGSRLLVSGTELKLYDGDLALLRDFAVPGDKRVHSVAWAPDGSRFVYVVGPAVFN